MKSTTYFIEMERQWSWIHKFCPFFLALIAGCLALTDFLLILFRCVNCLKPRETRSHRNVRVRSGSSHPSSHCSWNRRHQATRPRPRKHGTNSKPIMFSTQPDTTGTQAVGPESKQTGGGVVDITVRRISPTLSGPLAFMLRVCFTLESRFPQSYCLLWWDEIAAEATQWDFSSAFISSSCSFWLHHIKTHSFEKEKYIIRIVFMIVAVTVLGAFCGKYMDFQF